MIMVDIAAAFRKCNLNVVRAQIEPINDEGAKHTYCIQCGKAFCKLTDYQIERVKEELQAAIDRHHRQLQNGMKVSTATPRNSATDMGHSPSNDGKLPAFHLANPSQRFGQITSKTSDDQECRIRVLEDKLAAEQANTRSVQQKLLEQGQ